MGSRAPRALQALPDELEGLAAEYHRLTPSSLRIHAQSRKDKSLSPMARSACSSPSWDATPLNGAFRMSHVTKSYRAGFLGVNGCSRPGRDSQPFGLGLLIGAAISAVLWAAIVAVVFCVAALV